MRCVRLKRVIAFMLFSAVFSVATLKPSEAGNGAVVYTYDALGRILTASYDTGAFVIYTYDANGNRLTQSTNINATILNWCLTSGSCTATNKWGQALWN